MFTHEGKIPGISAGAAHPWHPSAPETNSHKIKGNCGSNKKDYFSTGQAGSIQPRSTEHLWASLSVSWKGLMKWIRILIAHLISGALTSGHSLMCVNGCCGARLLMSLLMSKGWCQSPRQPVGKAVCLSSTGECPAVSRRGKKRRNTFSL